MPMSKESPSKAKETLLRVGGWVAVIAIGLLGLSLFVK